MFFYFEASVHESNIVMFPPPTCIGQTVALLLHDYWAVYEPPPTSLLYALHHIILVITISCKGQTFPPWWNIYHERSERWVARTSLYVYIYAYICLFIYLYLYVCMYVYPLDEGGRPGPWSLRDIRICIYVYMYVYIYIYVNVCIYIYMCVCMYVYMLWYSFTSKLVCTNQSSFHCLSVTSFSHTTAIRLHDYCALYDPPPDPLLYGIHNTTLVVAILCRGQPGSCYSTGLALRGILHRHAP